SLGVNIDAQLGDVGVPLHHQRHVVDDLGRHVSQPELAAVAHEAELLVDLDLPLGEPHPLGAGIRAAVVVLDAVQRLGLQRAFVRRVGDAVLVVVRIGAAVRVFEPVGVFGLVGAVVEAVRDAVGVVVRVGAAVGVLEAVLVLGLVGALVALVGDPVAVAVLGGRRAAVVGLLALVVLGRVRAGVVDVGDAVLVVVGVGAAVGVLEVVEVLGLVRAPVLDVGDGVAVVVGVGAAVGVLEAVAILRLVGALVVGVVDAVVVPIAEVGVEGGHGEDAKVGRADAVAEPAPQAAGQRPHAVERPAPGQVDLERVDVVVELGELVEAAAPGDLQDDVGLRGDRVIGGGAVEELRAELGGEAVGGLADQDPQVAGGAHRAEVDGADRLDPAGHRLVAQVGAAAAVAGRQAELRRHGEVVLVLVAERGDVGL